MTALAVIVLWCAFLVRDVLLLIYVSGLLAIGFSPIVRLIERQKVLPIGTRRFPRWLAILVLYLVILGTLDRHRLHDRAAARRSGAAAVDGAARTCSTAAQDFLIAKGMLSEHLTLSEAVAARAERGGGEAVGTVLGAVVGVVGGLVRPADDPDPDLLHPGRGRQPPRHACCACSRARARARGRGEPRHHGQGQRVAGRPAAARRRSSAPRRPSACGCSAFRSSTCSR